MKRRVIVFGTLAVGLAIAGGLWFASAQRKARGWQKTRMTLNAFYLFVDPLQGYAIDHGRYPQTRSVDELHKALVPKYAKELRVKDEWGRPLNVEVNGQNYLLWSGGADGKADEEPWAYTNVWSGELDMNKRKPLRNDDFHLDLIMYNGDFIQYPEGLTLSFYTRSTTVLDAKGDRANTGTVYVTRSCAGQSFDPFGDLQILSGDEVIAGHGEMQYELPPGDYSARVTLKNQQHFHSPFTIQRGRYLFHRVEIPCQKVTVKRPPSLKYDIYSQGFLMASSPEGPVHTLPIGHYVVVVHAPSGRIDKEFEISTAPVDLAVDVP